MRKLMFQMVMLAVATSVASAQTTAAKPAAATTQPTATQAAPETPVAKASRATRAKYGARRDPFLNPVLMRNEAMAKTVACTTGARCLMIAQVTLKGVVKTQQGMIAMVENSARKQYNLREKDPVYSGYVLKITGDSVVFKENATDPSGRPITREVVKRVTVPVV